MSGMRIEVGDAVRSFGDVTALSGVDLEIAPGEFLAVAGRSGSGKTTLLGLIGGIDRPTSGTVRIDGDDLATLSRARRYALARETGLVLQGAAAIRRMPVWENVACGLIPLGAPPRERRKVALEALERVELGPFASRRPEALSAGERQRMALARALVIRPRLLVADEPTSNLDAESAAIVCDVLHAAAAAGATVVAASHDGSVLARATRTLRLERGRLAN